MTPFKLDNCKGYRYIPSELPEFLEKASPCAQRLWFYLIRKVKFEDSKNLKRGQTIATYKDLQNAISWIENKKVKTFTLKQIIGAVKYLVGLKIIDTKAIIGGSVGMVITFNYYNDLQKYENYKKGPGQGGKTINGADANGLDVSEKGPGQGVGVPGQGVGQGGKTINGADANGLDVSEKGPGQGVGQAMSILTNCISIGDSSMLDNHSLKKPEIPEKQKWAEQDNPPADDHAESYRPDVDREGVPVSHDRQPEEKTKHEGMADEDVPKWFKLNF